MARRRRRRKSQRPPVERFGLTYLGPSTRVELFAFGQDEPTVFERGVEVEVNKDTLWYLTRDMREKQLAARHRSRWHARPIPQELESVIMVPEETGSAVDPVPEQSE